MCCLARLSNVIKQYYLFVLLSFLSCVDVLAQVTAADCPNAVNICQNASFAIDPNGPGAISELQSGTFSNPSSNPGSSNSGCLLAGELNPTWMIINVASTGLLQFSFGADGGFGCLDWIMWPYTANTCTQILQNQIAPVRCNWNGMCESFTGIASPLPPGGAASNFEPPLNVVAGEQYLVCLSNYSSQTTNVPMNFFGTANISCNTVITVAVNSETICPGESVTLTATASGADSYLWSPGGETTSSITVSPSATTTYTCAVTGPGSNGGTSVGSGSGSVTVLPLSDSQCSCTTTASNSGPVCEGEAFSITTSAVPGGSYSWELSGTNIGNGQTIAGLSENASTLTYDVTATDQFGHVCTSSTAVTIYALPNVDAGMDTSICLGNSVLLNGTGANSYVWDNGVQNNIAFQPTIDNLYTVIGTDQNGCQNTDSVTVTILFAQNPSITPSETLGCKPMSVTFTNNDNSATNCQWTLGNGEVFSGCNGATALYEDIGCFSVSIYQVDGQGCDTAVTFPNLVCVEESIAEFHLSPGIIGASNSTVSFFNDSENAENVYWDFGDGQNSIELEPVHTYSTALQTGFVATLVTYSPAGCTDTAQNVVNYEEQTLFYIPNTFTPDDDEFNQEFLPVFTSGFDPYNYHLSIYNRWGEIVFESFDHTIGWNGAYGNDLGIVQSGVYTWTIQYKPKVNDEKLTVNGFVQVLR